MMKGSFWNQDPSTDWKLLPLRVFPRALPSPAALAAGLQPGEPPLPASPRPTTHAARGHEAQTTAATAVYIPSSYSTQPKQFILSRRARSLQAMTNGERRPCRPSPSCAPNMPLCHRAAVQEPSSRFGMAGSAGRPGPAHTSDTRRQRAQPEQQPGDTGLCSQLPRYKIAARLAPVHWKQERSWSPGKGRLLRTEGEAFLLHWAGLT